MRIILFMIAVILVVAAAYVAIFHALVAWRGHTIVTIYGTPAQPIRQTQRKIYPSMAFLSAIEERAVSFFNPLSDLECWWSQTPLASTDPVMSELHDALLMHAQVGDAQAAGGMSIADLHALVPGPEKNVAPSQVRIRFRDHERWILFTKLGTTMENALYVHDGTRIRRYYE